MQNKQSTPLLRCNAVRQTVANPDSQRKKQYEKRKKKVKKVSKITVARAFDRFLDSTDRTLHDVYATYSIAKEKAYAYCVQLMNKYNGYDLRIISHNTNKFTVGFIGYVNDELCFFYITADYDRYMSFADIQKKFM